jgi:hypothetical protein
MPFAEKFLDHLDYALAPAAHSNQLLLERLDYEHFTGDIVDEIKVRIERASAVVAVLDENNPNVFLEVGYAWGVRKPTVLILHEDCDPPFDVKGQKILRYNRLKQLEERLTHELGGLKSKALI